MLRRLRGAARAPVGTTSQVGATARSSARVPVGCMTVAALPTGVRPPTTLVAAVPADRSPSRAERRLADGLRRRDEAALGELHAACGRTVMGFLVRALGDRATAEDVFQQVFLEAWQRGPAYDPDRASPLTWVMTIARSRAIDQLRRRVPEPRDPPARSRCSRARRPEARRRRAGRALALRPPARPAARRGGRPAAPPLLRRRDADARSPRRPGIPLGTVKMRMVQGLARLRDLLDARGAQRMNERLSDYLLGELDARERAAFEAELARDPALAAEVERLRPVVTRLESLEPRRGSRRRRRRSRCRARRRRRRRARAAGGAARSCCARSPRPRSRWSCSRSASAPGCCWAATTTPATTAGASSRSRPSSRSAARRTAPPRSRRRDGRATIQRPRPAAERRRRLLRALAAQLADDLVVARLVPGPGLGRGRRHRAAARRTRTTSPRSTSPSSRPTATRRTPRARCCGRRSKPERTSVVLVVLDVERLRRELAPVGVPQLHVEEVAAVGVGRDQREAVVEQRALVDREVGQLGGGTTRAPRPAACPRPASSRRCGRPRRASVPTTSSQRSICQSGLRAAVSSVKSARVAKSDGSAPMPSSSGSPADERDVAEQLEAGRRARGHRHVGAAVPGAVREPAQLAGLAELLALGVDPQARGEELGVQRLGPGAVRQRLLGRLGGEAADEAIDGRHGRGSLLTARAAA